MKDDERRRADRIPVDVEGKLIMTAGRTIPVRLINVGGRGALLLVEDLEQTINEQERVYLEHPGFRGSTPHVDEVITRSIGVVVRVELDFQEDGISRHVAVFFDGGPAPQLDLGELGSGSVDVGKAESTK